MFIFRDSHVMIYTVYVEGPTRHKNINYEFAKPHTFFIFYLIFYCYCIIFVFQMIEYFQTLNTTFLQYII